MIAVRALTAAVASAGLLLAGCRGEGGDGVAAAGSGVVRDAAIGAKYGSAGPRICSDVKVPAGPVDAAQAATFVVCGLERELVDTLTLVSEIDITEVLPPRTFDGIEHDTVTGIDVSKPVQEIRGRMTVFECNRLLEGDEHGTLYKRGSNCWSTVHEDAAGLCYRTTNASIACTLDDANATTGHLRGLPPPV